jgi:signal transduction histidine kinase
VRIREQVQQLVALLDEVLVVMRGESVGLDFQPEAVDLDVLCAVVVNDTRPHAANHTIDYQAAFPHAMVTGDERLLRRALDNLLSNAIKYSPSGSTIHVDLSRLDGQLRLQVRDEGIGIPADQVTTIFEPFKRASNTGSIPGTGLGLALVKQIADLHGGDIAIESDEGSGTTVILLLDAATPESIAQSAPEAS